MNLKRRLECLEARRDACPRVHWANMHATRVEDIVPDGVIDWPALFAPRPAVLPDPADDVIARIARRSAPEATRPTDEPL